MNKQALATLMDDVFENEIMKLREAGQNEYAHEDDNAFANFDRVANHLGLSAEVVCMVYMLKHVDGVSSFVNGHKSQREDVTGRLNDIIVYCFILRGLIERERTKE